VYKRVKKTTLTIHPDRLAVPFAPFTTFFVFLMALPQSLRTSVTPLELELIASEQLVEIVPLITMEKTAFISVRCRGELPEQCLQLVVSCRVHMGRYDRQQNVAYPFGWRLI
jgi:hypothetical protein